MKNLWNGLLLLQLSIISFNAVAQESDLVPEPDYTKSRIFTDLPAQLGFDQNVFNLANTRRTGESLPLNVGGRVGQLQAAIVSHVVKYDGQIQSIVLRLPERDDAIVNISKITQPDGHVFYRGRIISHKHGDAYELQQVNAVYQFVKRDYYDLINE